MYMHAQACFHGFFVRLYIHTYIYTYTHIHTHTHTYIYTVCAGTNISRLNTHTHQCIQFPAYVCMYVCMEVWVFFTLQKHVYRPISYTYTHTYACTCIYIYIHAHRRVHTHIHTHMHTFSGRFGPFVQYKSMYKSLQASDNVLEISGERAVRYIHSYVCVCVCVCIYIHTQACIYRFFQDNCMYRSLQAYDNVLEISGEHAVTFIHSYICLCVCVCVYVCVYIYTHTQACIYTFFQDKCKYKYIYIYIYIYTHTHTHT